MFHTPTQNALLTDVESAVAWLKRHGTTRKRESMPVRGVSLASDEIAEYSRSGSRG